MNKFNRGPKLKLKTIRGTKNTILLIFFNEKPETTIHI